MAGLTFAEADEDLHSSLLVEIHFEGDDREALLERFSFQRVDFLSVEQQFAVATPLVLKDASLLVGLDIRIYEPHLSLQNTTKSVGQVGATVKDAFYFAAYEFDASLAGGIDGKVKSSLPIFDRPRRLRLLLCFSRLRHDQESTRQLRNRHGIRTNSPLSLLIASDDNGSPAG